MAGQSSWSFTCPYEALGLDPGADESSIKRAYRLKCKQKEEIEGLVPRANDADREQYGDIRFHPDLNKAENAEVKFISIGEAYEFLVGAMIAPVNLPLHSQSNSLKRIWAVTQVQSKQEHVPVLVCVFVNLAGCGFYPSRVTCMGSMTLLGLRGKINYNLRQCILKSLERRGEGKERVPCSLILFKLNAPPPPTQMNRTRGKELGDGSMTSGNSSAFHDWYWTFRMSRTWDKQQKAGPSRAAGPAGFASQPESKQELQGQIAGLRQRAAFRRRRSSVPSAAGVSSAEAENSSSSSNSNTEASAQSTWAAASGHVPDTEQLQQQQQPLEP
eukprot:scaffold149199_cov17-Tisochrysis_lutea.AAC.1